MKWTVSHSVACPSTGTFFLRIVSEKKLQLILWYSGENIITTDSVIIPGVRHIFNNGEPFKMDVLKTLPGNDEMWQCLKRNTGCPGNTGALSDKCTRMTVCAFDVCPWGKEQGGSVR